MTITSAPPEPPRPKRRIGDRVFAGSATGAGVLILLVLAGVALFLISEAWPAVTAPSGDIAGGKGLSAYIAPLIFGTLLAAVIALLIATPLAVLSLPASWSMSAWLALLLSYGSLRLPS